MLKSKLPESSTVSYNFGGICIEQKNTGVWQKRTKRLCKMHHWFLINEPSSHFLKEVASHFFKVTKKTLPSQQVVLPAYSDRKTQTVSFLLDNPGDPHSFTCNPFQQVLNFFLYRTDTCLIDLSSALWQEKEQAHALCDVTDLHSSGPRSSVSCEPFSSHNQSLGNSTSHAAARRYTPLSSPLSATLQLTKVSLKMWHPD